MRLLCAALILTIAVAVTASLAGAVAVNHAVNGVTITAKTGTAGVASQAYIPPWLSELWRLRDIFMKDFNRVHFAYASAVPEGAWTSAEDPANVTVPSNDAKEKLYEGTQERAYLDLASRFESRMARDEARVLERSGESVTEATVADLRDTLLRSFGRSEALSAKGFTDQANERVVELMVAHLKPGMKTADAKRALDRLELTAFQSTDGHVLGMVVFDKQTGDTHAVFDVKSKGKPGWGRVTETVAFDWQIDPKVGTFVEKSAEGPILLAKAKVAE